MASTHLSHSEVDPQGNRQTFTVSSWVKRSGLGSEQAIWSHYYDTSNYISLRFDAGDSLRILSYVGGVNTVSVSTNALYRDTSAWYHIVVTVDTTESTTADRIKIYVNGSQITSLSSTTYPGLNDNLINDGGAGYSTFVGARASSSQNLNGSIAHFHYVQGTAYQASTFGSSDSTTGIWKPNTSPSVTYGSKGFFLKFANSGSMGTDSSGNSKNFTVSGNLTQTQDTPSNVFATFNPLDNYYNASTFSNGNNTITTGSSNVAWNTATFGVSSGKWYWETELDAESSGGSALFGISDAPATSGTNNELGGLATTYAYLSSGNFRTNNANTSNGVSATVGDIIGIALNLDDNQISYYKNGTIIGSAQSITAPSSTNTGVYFPAWGDWLDPGTVTFKCNFGNGYFGTTAVSSAQSPSDGIGLFEYSVPSGYKALCTKSINSQEYS